MKNINFLKKILMSNAEYWLVRTENYDIILLGIPSIIDRNLSYDEIKLHHLDFLGNLEINTNIYLDKPYAPFQQGLLMSEICDGYPITGNVKEFLKSALTMEPSKIFEDYLKLITL